MTNIRYESRIRVSSEESIVCVCLQLDWFVACGLALAGVGGQTEVDVSVKDLAVWTYISYISLSL